MIKMVFIGLFLVLASCVCAEEARYAPEECIVRVNIHWSNESSIDKESMILVITDGIRKAPDMGFNRIPASSAVQGDEREYIYYQHKYDCDNRWENMEKLLSYIRDNIDDLPQIEVDPGKFSSGTDTIRASGPWWRKE